MGKHFYSCNTDSDKPELSRTLKLSYGLFTRAIPQSTKELTK